MENVSIPVEEGQLIVGIRGTGVKETPTFPEVCVHSMEDLGTLDTRENMPYKVDADARSAYREVIIPGWKGKAMRDVLFQSLPEDWIESYEAGIWTEFMEQRAPGHTAGGTRIFDRGVLDVEKEVSSAIKSLNPSDPQFKEKREELKAMEIVCEAIITYATRYSMKLKELASVESDRSRKRELETMADICREVPANKPRSFWEALQHYWFIHVGITYETNPWDSFTPGRLDQHLFPLYQSGIESGDLTREEAKELLQAFWVKFNNQPAVPKVGVTAEESTTYNDFSKINIGGLREDGSDGVNELSYLILEVLGEMRTLQPNMAVLISDKNPDRFLVEALKIIGPGFGEPPLFNADQIVVNKLRQNKMLRDARTSGVSGCVESGAFGKECYVLTGYFNLPKILEITMNNGVDPRTGKRIGIVTGDASKFRNFDDLMNAFIKQTGFFLDTKMKGNDLIEENFARKLPVPFLSLWLDDCVRNGKDYNSGGTRYNTQYIQIVGLGTISDSLADIKHHIFDHHSISMKDLISAIKNNFDGFEELHELLKNPYRSPKFGNDDDYVDGIAKDLVHRIVDMVEAHEPTPVRKAQRRVYFLPTTAHVYFGKVTGATPDGRVAGFAVSEGISPVQGMDRHGIASVFRSITKADWSRTGGCLLNQRLTPDLFSEESNVVKLAALIRGYFRSGGFHVQFNVVTSQLLREAQKKPEDFRDLMVRVAGYSDYFVNLPRGLQEEIIARTEHENL